MTKTNAAILDDRTLSSKWVYMGIFFSMLIGLGLIGLANWG